MVKVINMNIIKYATNWKYRFFTKKYHDVRKVMAELEFKVDKAKQVREGIRLDRDRELNAVANVEATLKNTKDKKEKEKLEAEKAVFEANAKRFEAQMKMIDNEIHGVIPSEGVEGQPGILHALDSYAELREMYKQYRSK